jgi:hypothetical protein
MGKFLSITTQTVFNLRLVGALILVTACGYASNAGAVGANANKTEAAPERTSGGGVIAAPMPERVVETVVVWGFRFRSTIHDTRSQSLTAGYNELSRKDSCRNSVCGFLVVRDGNVWRASNALAATEDELLQRQRDLERGDTILVIVHPTEGRRALPKF